MATWSGIPTDVRKTDVSGVMTFDERIFSHGASDYQLRRDSDNQLYDLNSRNTTITNLGNNAYRITVTFAGVSGLGQQADTFYLRLKARSVRFLSTLSYTPPNNVDSAGFSLDTFPPVTVALTFARTTNLRTGDTVTINVAFNRDVTGLLLTHFSTDAGTLSNLQGSGRNWSVDLTLPPAGSAAGTATVTLAANSVLENPEATASVSYAEALHIAAIAEHSVVINTDFNLNVRITGNPATVKVQGLMEGFHYNWSAAQKRVEIRGSAKQADAGRMATITAEDQMRVFIYNAIPPVPVITPIPRQDFRIGRRADILVPISAGVANANLIGEWIGLEFEKVDEGIRIFGVVPNKVFTIDAGTLALEVDNGSEAGRDTADIAYRLLEPLTPGTPTSLALTAELTQIIARWAPPTGDAGVGITGYEIRLDSGQWLPLEHDVRDYTFSELQSNRNYTVSIRAVDDVNVGPTESRTIRTLTDAVAPGPPTSVSINVTSNSATLSWSPPASDGGSPITGYEVRLDSGRWIRTSASARSRVFANFLISGQSYTFSVRALNSVGTSTAVTRTATTATQASAPGVPTSVTAQNTQSGSVSTAIAADRGKIFLNWAPPASDGGSAITGYEVRLDSGEWITLSISARSHTFSELGNGASRSVSVRAVNAEGNSQPVTQRETTLDVPPAPSNFSVTVDNPQNEISVVRFSWTAPTLNANMPPITRYNVYQNNSGTWSIVSQISAPATSGFHHLFTEFTQYRIAAENVVGIGPQSETFTVTNS